jgi:hypothetical protein
VFGPVESLEKEFVFRLRYALLRAAPLAVALILMANSAFGDHLAITRYFSGAWAAKEHQSQGLMLHITEQPDESKAGVVHWFTFGNDLETAWFVAVGTIEGHEIHMTLFSASGVGFLEPEALDSVAVEEIGTLILSFHNCNQGAVFFDTPAEILGSGEFDIRRLTSLYHSRCSGGVSDDTPSDRRPQKYDVALLPARDDISGKGKAMYWERADRSDFKVTADGIPDDAYDLTVCGDSVGTLEVTGGEGSLEFRSPGIDSKALLDFIPLTCQINLDDAVGTALTSGDSVLAATDKGGPATDPPGGGSKNFDISVELTSTGHIDGAEGEATYKRAGSHTEFEVKISGIPAGPYPLVLDTVEIGQINVVEDDGQFKGRLRFKNPAEPDSDALDFDPRGKLIEILQGEVVILESLFPDE